MKRILLLGKNGQLGWELQRCLAPLGDIYAVDTPQLDLSQPHSCRTLVQQLQPQVIVNATAYTAVDRAESEPDLAIAINAAAPALLAELAQQTGAALLHFSTDYVFDGAKGAPYVESDPPNPLNAYGRSKLAGEQAIQAIGGASLVLRTSWVYSLRRDSFVTRVLAWSRTQPTLRVVSDQVGNPTWARMLAEITAQLLAYSPPDIAGWMRERTSGSPEKGLFHLAGDGYASRLEWAQAILRNDPHPEEQVCTELQPARTVDFPTPAQRPLMSALDCGRFTEVFGLRLPAWEQALGLAMDHLP